MVIVSDTSPLSYLILIGKVGLLGTLCEVVRIPPAVREELDHPNAPSKLHHWIHDPPSWLTVQLPPRKAPKTPDSGLAEALGRLDRGEREAIRLAKHADADLLVIDERDGRKIAKSLGVPITGLIGVLDVAATEGIIDVADVVRRLRKTSFRASPELYRWLLERH